MPLNELRVVNKHHGLWPNRRYVHIGRPSVLGNPFPIKDGATREEVIAKFEEWLFEQLQNGNASVMAELDSIASMVMDGSGEQVCLVCYCHPKACHGDIIKKVVLKAIEQNT